MDVSLAEHWQNFIREEVQSGRFPSESAVLEEALALLQQREHEVGPFRPQSNQPTEPKPIGTMIDDLMADVPKEVLTSSRPMVPSSTIITSTAPPSDPHDSSERVYLDPLNQCNMGPTNTFQPESLPR